MNERALRAEICDVARVLYERGHNAPPDGNITARLSERYLLCTPTMCHKGRLRPEQIVKVSAVDGRSVDPSQKASSEIRMHLAIYSARADVHAIVHAHSPSAVGLTVARISMEQPVVPEVILALGSVPTIPYASPTTEDVPAIVLEYVHEHDAFLLERHGPVALGKNLEEAFMRLEVIEHTAKITIAALAAGSAEPIDADERGKLLALGGRATERAALDKLVDLIADRVVMRLKIDA
jgi:L-fuculose-phosphate aldolase